MDIWTKKKEGKKLIYFLVHVRLRSMRKEKYLLRVLFFLLLLGSTIRKEKEVAFMSLVATNDTHAQNNKTTVVYKALVCQYLFETVVFYLK